VVADALIRLDTDIFLTTARLKHIAEIDENTDDKSLRDLEYPLNTRKR
jgi:hypothetical protein